MLRVLQICTNIAEGLAFLHATPIVPSTSISELQDACVQISVHGPTAGAESDVHSDAVAATMAASTDQGFATAKAARIVHRGE
jgi:hypothetical protein